MKVSIDQYCINVSDLDKSVHFYETVLGLKITHRRGIGGKSCVFENANKPSMSIGS